MEFHSHAALQQSLLLALQDEAAGQQLTACALPAVWLQTRRADAETGAVGATLGLTRLGGLPDLPQGMPWPTRPAYPDADQRGQYPRAVERPFQGRLQTKFPLNFLAQINFAQLHAVAQLGEDWPSTGLLSIFYDLTEQPWGSSPADGVGLHLHYIEDASAPLQRCAQPQALQQLPAHWQMAALECRLQGCVTPLPLASTAWKALSRTLDDEVSQRYEDWYSDTVEPGTDGQGWECHHAGGWPTPVQEDMQTQCALVHVGLDSGQGEHWCDPATLAVRQTATDWLLLLQVGSDAQSGMQWGDEGQLYLWMRREDLRARRFERAQLVLQCY